MHCSNSNRVIFSCKLLPGLPPDVHSGPSPRPEGGQEGEHAESEEADHDAPRPLHHLRPLCPARHPALLGSFPGDVADMGCHLKAMFKMV